MQLVHFKCVQGECRCGDRVSAAGVAGECWVSAGECSGGCRGKKANCVPA